MESSNPKYRAPVLIKITSHLFVPQTSNSKPFDQQQILKIIAEMTHHLLTQSPNAKHMSDQNLNATLCHDNIRPNNMLQTLNSQAKAVPGILQCQTHLRPGCNGYI